MDKKNIKTDLTSIAQSRLAYYQELVSLAEAQRELLVGGRHSELADNLKAHDPILIEIGRLDKREEALVSLLTDTESDSGYRQLIQTTAKTAARLAELTRINAELLENAREFVAFSIGIIAKSVNESCAIGDSVTDSNGALLLDKKV